MLKVGSIWKGFGEGIWQVLFCSGERGLELHEGQTLASCHLALLKAWLLRGLES